ncbi:hypothetical protein [Streptomyces sp. NBC_00096]|uniref:hypothetical protein n=1 Tax=Streptomyces sp. NBC_00096 TaxID=2975650 RepID=UPI0032475ABB
MAAGNWMDRDIEVERRWTRLGGRPIQRACPLARLLGLRKDGVRAAGELTRQTARSLPAVRYLYAPAQEAGAQFEALELVGRSRHLLVRGELCVDPIGPMLLQDREGLSAALYLLRAGFAYGPVTPKYEHIGPDLREYEHFLKEMAACGWFIALALPETGQ